MNFKLSGFAVLLALSGEIASAATGETYADTTLCLGDVTVTAIKQQSDLSLQPLSATVMTGAQARLWHVNSVKRLSEIAPNFFMPDYGSRMTSSIYVRGIGARMDQPVIGLSVDNLPYLNKDGYDFDMADIERIEVLRGPQSTLYGRNTMGGEINIYTLSPMTYQGSRVMGQVGNGPHARMSVSHYAKFNPQLAMAFIGDFNFSDGYYKNRYNARKVDTEKSGSVRWRTQWNPSAGLSIDNVASFSITRQSGYPYEYMGSGVVNYNDTCYYWRNAFSDGLTLRWNVGNISLSSITGFHYLHDDMTLDQDFLPVSYFTLTQKRKEWSLSEELVARGTHGVYSWIVGAFAFYRHTTMNAPVTIKDDGIKRLITGNINDNDHIPVKLKFIEPELLLGSDFEIPVWNVALYHQSDLRLGDWTLSAGLRVDYEKTSLDYHSLCNADYSVFMKSGVPPMPVLQGTVGIDDGGTLQQNFWEFIPKVSVSYDLPMESGSSIYASIGEGYKSGGYNTQMFSEILQSRMKSQMMQNMPGMSAAPQESVDVDRVISYKPERSWNYEIGAHIGCAGGKVMTDLALFYIDCRNQQLTMLPEGSITGRITTNAGRTRSFGAEVQIRYNPTDRWAFNVSYGYTNAKFLQFTDNGKSYKGNNVPYAPLNTMFASAGYHHHVAGKWSLAYNLNLRGVGRIYWNEANTLHQPFYAQLGASVAAMTDWLTLEAWMENITGTRFNTFYFESIKNNFVQRGKPRRFGFTVRMNFDAR